MTTTEIYELMIGEYKEACREYYEVQFGEKVNNTYTIMNKTTGEVITGSVSGRKYDEPSRQAMMVIRRMMIQAFGEDVKGTLEKIRKGVRKKEQEFFEKNPQYVIDVTCHIG